VQEPHPPIWLGGGSSPETADLAARLGFHLMLPSAFGNPAVFRDVVQRFLEAYSDEGHATRAKIGACWHVNVACKSQDAKARWEPRYRLYHQWMNELLGRINPALPRHMKPFDYDWLTTKGPAIVGSPAEVVDRIERLSELLDVDTHLIYMDMGGMPEGEFLDMIGLFGGEVISSVAADLEASAP
jgi:alkanesulfonate monooxygenase SsuD/methylene tetrahydromethanopterin reductase-like flavin-dependent oxidoreductase (luciferase family)